jgi:hypothetical protein
MILLFLVVPALAVLQNGSSFSPLHTSFTKPSRTEPRACVMRKARVRSDVAMQRLHVRLPTVYYVPPSVGPCGYVCAASKLCQALSLQDQREPQ